MFCPRLTDQILVVAHNDRTCPPPQRPNSGFDVQKIATYGLGVDDNIEINSFPHLPRIFTVFPMYINRTRFTIRLVRGSQGKSPGIYAGNTTSSRIQVEYTHQQEDQILSFGVGLL